MTSTFAPRRRLDLRRVCDVGMVLAVCGAPGTAQTPCADAVVELARSLDAAFEDGDAVRYLEAFEPLHAQLRKNLEHRIRRVLGSGADLRRQTEVHRHWRLGEHTIALVETETRNTARPDLGPVQEHAIWALRGPDAAPRIELAVEVDAAHLEAVPDSADPLQPKREFRCRACNYSIDAGDSWLMVPTRASRIGALESLSFFSLRHDLAVDLSIHLADGERVPTPAEMLADLVELVLGPDVDVAIDPWLPPMYTRDNRPTYLEGARCAVDAEGERCELHVASYGRLGYFTVVHGPSAVIERNRAEIDALLRSFALDDPALEPEQVILRITQERQGGLLEGHVYTNSRHGVRFEGPHGFRARMAASLYAFEVRWSRADGAVSVHLKGLAPPDGMPRWSPDAAERALRLACDRGEYEVVDDGGWIDGRQGFARERRLRTRRDVDGVRESVAVRLALAPDLLVVVEAHATTDSEAEADAALEGLLEPLQRTR